MNVLHITTTTTGGAALATLRLHHALLYMGINSRVLVLNNTGDVSGVYEYGHSDMIDRLIRSLLYRMNLGIGKYWRMHDTARQNGSCQYSYPLSTYRVENHPLVKTWADIVHLHWCDDFVNYPTFFTKIRKPIVWTLHDISIGYGGFHYKSDYSALKDLYHDMEESFVSIKRNAIQSCDKLSFVSLSQEMCDFCESVEYLRDRRNVILPNVIDTSIFDIYPREECRMTLNMSEQKRVVLFVSEYVDNPNKGLVDLIDAVSGMPDTELWVIGHTGKQSSDKIKYVGKISDTSLLARYYSASDLLAIPSRQESFAQTALESMACGTPVVAFPCGCLPQVINDTNGIVCNTFSIVELKEAIEKVFSRQYNPDTIRQQIVSEYSPQIVAQKYINFYQSIL